MLAVVCGMIATFPVGGVLWDYGQYLLALQALGFDVVYLEDTDQLAYDPETLQLVDRPEYGARFVARELEALSPSLRGRWHVRGIDGSTFGMDAAAVRDAVEASDVLVNVSASAVLRPDYGASRRTLLVDTDPGWTQLGNLPTRPGFLAAHDVCFSYAEALGTDRCPLPALGRDWWPTRPPVALDRWTPEPPGETYTTVLSWSGNYPGAMTLDGRPLGGKEREFRHIERLPGDAPAPLEIAAGGVAPPVERWRAAGWRVVDAGAISATAADYRHYLQGSRGEVSVAKEAYVATASAWFSCRTVCYLAAGRPAIVEDTGFSRHVACGEGLLAFEDGAGAAAALQAVEADYEAHAAAARALAEREFAGERVVAEMLDRAGVAG